MKDNLIRFPVQTNTVKNKLNNKIELPTIITGVIENSRLKEVGIYEGDELVVNTMETVGNGDLIIVQSDENYDCGFARFLGDGKLMLTYYNTQFEPVIYELSEIKIIGRVLHSSRDWRSYASKLEQMLVN